MHRLLFAAACALLLAVAPAIADDKPEKPAKPAKRVPKIKLAGYTTRLVEGFTVFVSDEAKSHEEDAKYERKPMEVLELELAGIGRVMQPKILKALQTVKVFVEWEDPESKPKNGGPGVVVARYWYDSGRGIGMLQQGRDPHKANNIEILNMRHLTEKWQPGKSSDQIILLHEMCHAVHAHILGNDNVQVKSAYNQAMDRGLYNEVKHESGRTAKAYAATNDHEYFAELSCSFLDRCAYYPFTREQLKEHDSVGYKLMEYYWTPKDPRSAKSKAAAKSMETKPEKPSPSAEKPAATAESGPAAESAAKRKLDLIDSLIKANRKDKAREKLQEVIDSYPTTDAAKKAKELLEGLK